MSRRCARSGVVWSGGMCICLRVEIKVGPLVGSQVIMSPKTRHQPTTQTSQTNTQTHKHPMHRSSSATARRSRGSPPPCAYRPHSHRRPMAAAPRSVSCWAAGATPACSSAPAPRRGAGSSRSRSCEFLGGVGALERDGVTGATEGSVHLPKGSKRWSIHGKG